MLKLTIRGVKETEEQLKRIGRGARAMARTVATVGSAMPYAYGAEYGYHRISRKLARRVGPSYYLFNAADIVFRRADGDISEGLKKVTAPGPWVLRRLAGWVRRTAKTLAPRGGAKKSPYRLRKSIRYYVRSR